MTALKLFTVSCDGCTASHRFAYPSLAALLADSAVVGWYRLGSSDYLDHCADCYHNFRHGELFGYFDHLPA